MASVSLDTPALLEWLNAVDVRPAPYRDLADAADGRAFLRVMHDLDPDGFPSPDEQPGHPAHCPPVEHLPRLAEGLEVHLRDRCDSGFNPAVALASQVRAGRPAAPVELAKLVLVATIENDFPRRRHYVEAMMRLSVAAQEAVRAIVERFHTGADAESPGGFDHAGESSARSPFAKDLAFTPPSRSAHARGSPKDFTEVGLDADTRVRRLKEQYTAAMEEQERLLEERRALKGDLEAERTRRREAEEAERVARAELRLAEEARDRVKEEQRGLFELRLQQEAQRFKEHLRERDEEIESLREDLSLVKGQAANVERLGSQLELAKQKLEEQQAFRRENEELRVQLDEVMARGSGGGAGDHLHRSLARAREEALAAARERDEANRQGELLREELEREQGARRKAAEELKTLRRDAGGASAGEAAATLAVPAASSAKSPKGSSVHELKQLLHTQKDDLMERLLTEKERATRAETSLQAKVSEVTAMAEQRALDSAKVVSLEAQVEGLQQQLAAAGGGAPAPAEGAAGDAAKVQEVEALLAQRDRELQVLQWRGQSDSQALVAQETLMASCFHEVGLRYQRLLAQNQALQRRLNDQGG